MINLFVYKSKVEFPLDMPPEIVSEKFLVGLKKWLSKRSGQDAERDGNKISFTVTLNAIDFTFIGIDSGDLEIEIIENKVIVHYELSYMFPLMLLIWADLLLFIISYFMPSHAEYLSIAFIGGNLLIVFILVIVLSILNFPVTIREKWVEACRSDK